MILSTKKRDKYFQLTIEELESTRKKEEDTLWKMISTRSSSSSSPSSSSSIPRTAEQLAFLSARREIAKRRRANMKALKGDLDAITLDMGSSKTSLLDSAGDSNENETQAKPNRMQGVVHPHRSGDVTGADPSSEESECSTDTHASPSSGYAPKS
ncbi:PREDICTED: uncharacterized protein LOC104714213 [Camelina sativa]|uniref:Uncharacterized protein LOC104714213 n=1 Tax=Camelina sativa TaxID=90675 RepID=A0ABM0TQN1_CAMSA|nr:PREDICTED: uncharacterized protein LOC104714213 [Camelina sativa]XP_010429799.1 PREDICTED: uncharacterized protein LOC104714213 [Camelina sativa]XP_010429800.1 PREDICTED: uncharacterized protein LOC104714213 [Camelina sativa]XP_010429801.1 PREDICTED: uncharacterized protein LOC104714213 [Camelina sativa]